MHRLVKRVTEGRRTDTSENSAGATETEAVPPATVSDSENGGPRTATVAAEGSRKHGDWRSTSAQSAEKKATGGATAQPTNPQTNNFRAGQLSKNLSFWLSLPLTAFVSRVLTDGLDILFTEDGTLPESNFLPRPSCFKHEKFVEHEINKLLDTGAITVCVERPLLCSPLHVAVASSGKQRLILDLTELNKSVKKFKVKFDDLEKIQYCLPKNGFMTQFDLRSGYHQIKMTPKASQLLGFVWNGVFYRYVVLPFGLCTGPAVFTKVFRSLVAKWRAEGINVAMYLDDGLIWARNPEDCARFSARIRADLRLAGSDLAEEKCVWIPTQELIWLGFNINLKIFYVRPATARRSKLANILSALLREKSPSVLLRQKFVGSIMSILLTMGELAIRKCRYTMITIAEYQEEQQKKVPSQPEELAEWKFWEKEVLEQDLGRFLDLKHTNFDAVLFCDASEKGAGSVCVVDGRKVVSFERLGKSSGESSTFRELHAVSFGLETFGKILENKRVLLKTDNTGAVSIINKGSMKLELHRWSQKIWDIANQRKIDIRAKWVPRAQNEEADAASRESDVNDWAIADKTFENLKNVWCDPTCDFFADHQNTKCKAFFSNRYTPGCLGIDAFEYPEVWSKEVGWVVPPVHLVAKTIRFASMTRAKGILGCPWWESQPYVQLMYSNAEKKWAPWIEKTLILPAGSKIFKSGATSDTFPDEFARFTFVFVKFNFADAPS